MKKLVLAVLVAACGGSQHDAEPSRIVIGGDPPPARAGAEVAPAAPPAPAAGAISGDRELARQLYEAANNDYNLGRYDEAAQHFKEAYAAWPDPIMLFNIAQAERQGGHCPEALAHYQEFLRTATDASEKVRKRVEEQIAALGSCPTGSGPVDWHQD